MAYSLSDAILTVNVLAEGRVPDDGILAPSGHLFFCGSQIASGLTCGYGAAIKALEENEDTKYNRDMAAYQSWLSEELLKEKLAPEEQREKFDISMDVLEQYLEMQEFKENTRLLISGFAAGLLIGLAHEWRTIR